MFPGSTPLHVIQSCLFYYFWLFARHEVPKQRLTYVIILVQNRANQRRPIQNGTIKGNQLFSFDQDLNGYIFPRCSKMICVIDILQAIKIISNNKKTKIILELLLCIVRMWFHYILTSHSISLIASMHFDVIQCN